jgi:hypothetical protein
VLRTSRSTEAGCKADHAADQARTDNGSQETASRARVRAARARFSPLCRSLAVLGERCRVMVLGIRCHGRAAAGAVALQAFRAQGSMMTGSPSGVRSRQRMAAFASQ